MLQGKECVKEIDKLHDEKIFCFILFIFEKCQSVTTKWKCGKKRKMSKTTDETDPKAENI